MIYAFKYHDRFHPKAFNIALSFAFREYLPLFKGALLPVFLGVMLSVDRDGHAYTDFALLEQRTGFKQRRLSEVIAKLTGQDQEGAVIIGDGPALGRWRRRRTTQRYATPEYTILPGATERLVSVDHRKAPPAAPFCCIEWSFRDQLWRFHKCPQALAVLLALTMLSNGSRAVTVSLRELSRVTGYDRRTIEIGINQLTTESFVDRYPLVLRDDHIGRESTFLLWPSQREIDASEPFGPLFAVKTKQPA